MACLKINRMTGKIMTMVWLLSLSVCTCNAQTVAGSIFNQSGTQMDYYLQQIAALGVYSKDLTSGYKTVKNGLGNIHDAKNGEFNLHQAYFNSLSSVNPAIRNDPKVNGILNYQNDIDKEFNNVFRQLAGSKQVTADESTYIKSVYNNLLAGCNKDLDELSLVITNGKVQMTDDERIKRIDKLYADMQDKSRFAQSFTNKAIVLTIQKAHEQNNAQVLQQLYQLKQ